ncbi:hypothetical protein LUZ60_000243 [Juncus effusus]|nr:hypothetical protein LUZ60_000243 [Juncus effusus]
MVGKTISISGFPLSSNAEYAKTFLENVSGIGSIYALKFRHPKTLTSKSKAYCVVQFLAEKDAERISVLANGGTLRCQGCYLKSRYMEKDIMPKPRSFEFVFEDATAHFGCLVDERSLEVLWRVPNVKVKFGFHLRKMYFSLREKYKLELSYESIWEIQLHRSPTQRSQFLLIQVQAAPKIYTLQSNNSSLMYESSLYNYFMETSDDQWVRSTDFSPSSSIGQSSIICLQLPYDYELPNIREYFVFYEEFEGYFEIKHGSSYSKYTDLVPIVQPNFWINVPYEILFKVNHMVQNGTLSGPTLDDKFFTLVSPNPSRPTSHVEHALEKLSYSKKTCLDPSTWLVNHYTSLKSSVHVPKSPKISLDDGLVYVHRVQITPSKVYFYGPEINVSNRVIRHYKNDLNNFLRVSFVDEDCEKMYGTDLSSKVGSSNSPNHTSLYNRVLSVLKNGIQIGDKKFEFLAFSSSQLRENSTWMFASRAGLTARDIRNWMGEFHQIRNVAKYAARLGQSFSSSTESLTVTRDEMEMIPDVTNGTNYVFSDGIGKISHDFAKRVAKKCGLSGFTPSGFQIRYGGYKGVVAINPNSRKKLSLRKSMSKFESENIGLDILAYTKYQPCYLNRQLITLLSTLGVRDGVFEIKQEEVVDQLNQVLTDRKVAYDTVMLMSPSETTNLLKELLEIGYEPDKEPFLAMMLGAYRAVRIFELRTKARIFVPKGRSMMGCLDENRILEYGEVFVQVSDSDDGSYKNKRVITGRVVVAKNPCLHPGDIRVLHAVDVPDLYHMVDCVVFPQKGRRPHPNECSGSDLDGDIYFVSWDQYLIPPRVAQPMDYSPAPTTTLDHDVTIEEVQEYFTNYILNESLGKIANAHTVFADKEYAKAESSPCLELARLFSIAVDFPKTGVPAETPQHLHVKEYPDFMEKLGKPTYISNGVIGKLYRAIKEHSTEQRQIRHFTKEVARRRYDSELEVHGFREFLDEAFWLKEDYDFKLGNLMEHYGIKTEAELITGYIMKWKKNFTKYKDGEAIRLAVKSLRKEARSWFNEKSADLDADEDDDEVLYKKASAWYHVTYHVDYFGLYNEGLSRPHFISFPWCVYDKLIMIKKKKIGERRINNADLIPRMRRFALECV